MGEDCSSVKFAEGDVRGDSEEPGMHVSGEHILASTISSANDHFQEE